LSTNTIGVAVMIRRQWNFPSMQRITLGTVISTYHIGYNEFEWLVVTLSPSFEMFQMAKDQFKEVVFGDPQVGHVSPTGVDKAVFPNEDGTMNGVMKEMVEGIIGILECINESVNDEDKFHHLGVKARVQQCINELKKKAADQKENGSNKTKHLEGLAKLDFAEFGVMIADQICCLGKMASLGAADQLSHLKDKNEMPEILNTIICEIEVEEYGTNSAEGLLCETSEG
jgi:hypothetical protein